jgi:N-methylhydantoinase A
MPSTPARRRSRVAMQRVAIDVGGTFTDVCVLDDSTGEVRTAKVPTSVDDPLTSVVKAIEALSLDLSRVQQVIHSTTITTNALVMRDFPPAALVTTQGFRDVIEIRDGTQEDPWDAYHEVAPPYIRRRDRYEVPERMDYSGRILQPLDRERARVIAEEVCSRGAKTVAVCFLNSYANALHEEEMGDILTNVDPTLQVSLSSSVLPEINEYERFSATVANALLGSLVTRYIGRLADHLRSAGYSGDLLLMHSGGGSMTAPLAQAFPLRLAASSIAAGAMAARHVAQQCGYQDAVALDMGGTSSDITLVQDGQVRVTKQWWVEYGHPISFPGVELATIGAGGGTIAWVDETGALRSGPKSAGAHPGPASYLRGGTEATNTDANLLLGRLSDTLAGGVVVLDRKAAEGTIGKRVAEPLDVTALEAASSVIQVADSAVASAVRLLRQGRRSLSPSAPLVAFGGAGPMHAVAIAQELGISTVIIPSNPGTTSALGCLLVDIRHDFTAMYQGNASDIDPQTLEERLLQIESEARQRLDFEGVAEPDIVLERSVSMRYRGQWRSLDIPMGRGKGALASAVQAFQDDYQAQYAYRDPIAPVEVYQLNLTAIGRLPEVPFRRQKTVTTRPAPVGTRMVAMGTASEPVATPVYDRTRLRAGQSFEGPAVIEQADATTIVPRGFRTAVDEWGNLRINEVSRV